MAGFRQHIAVSATLGAAYGIAGVWYGQFDPGVVFLGAGLTALGGMLPDLDSDSGVAVRELFSLAAAAASVLLIPRLGRSGMSIDSMLVFLAGVYLFVRYVVSGYFKHITVHRGMFHSIPALLISGLLVFLLYHNGAPLNRFFLAGGVMVGFLSHLVLDEIWSIDLSGAQIRLNRYAGSALKWASPSITANAFCYTLLAFLAAVAWVSF